MEDKHIRKTHNVSLLLYHFVCPAKYRKVIFGDKVDNTLVEICKDMELRYDIRFEEIGTDDDHVHFLIQSVPMYSPKQIIQKIKSITAIWLFEKHKEIKKQLRWWELWSKWYYVNTVGHYGNLDMIKEYVKNQWVEWYKKLYKSPYKTASLFDGMTF